MQAVSEIHQSLSGVKLGQPQSYANLTVFPLIDDRPDGRDYVLIDEALERKLARTTEVSQAGRVPELAFENTSSDEILLVDGDELVGAKQNRILNLSILVGAGKSIVIPVSCVEQGRWSYRSTEFQSARRSLFAKARARKASQVTASLRTTRTRTADQSQVWADVSEKVAFYQVDSQTRAMGDVYESRAGDLDRYVAAFRAVPGQRGAVIAIDSKPVGLELFGAAAAFSRYLAKLVRSYALDALETAAAGATPPSPPDAHRFLDAVGTSSFERFPALGEGEDLRFTGSRVVGGALAAEGRLVHLTAFVVA